MIVVKKFFINGKEFNRVYSDEGRYVVRNGVSYEEACDLAEYERQYTEGDVMPADESELADKAEAYDILMGVES